MVSIFIAEMDGILQVIGSFVCMLYECVATYQIVVNGSENVGPL